MVVKIIRLKHSDIDFAKYDDCIKHSHSGRVYAMSWYLNVVSPGWSLLMADDYSIVMPMSVKSRYKIKYLIQPYFCQQLGVFSKCQLNEEVFKAFIKSIKYRYINLQLNTANVFTADTDNLRQNFSLDLSKPYSEIASNYNSNCQRNIKKAKSFGQEIREIDTDDYIFLLKQNSEAFFNDKMYELLKKLIIAAKENGKGKLLSVVCNGKVVAAGFVVKENNRLYNLSPFSCPEGKEKQSMSFLIDNIIKENSQTETILDFEGSSISGVAKFYAGFGAELEYFPVFKKTRWF